MSVLWRGKYYGEEWRLVEVVPLGPFAPRWYSLEMRYDDDAVGGENWRAEVNPMDPKKVSAIMGALAAARPEPRGERSE